MSLNTLYKGRLIVRQIRDSIIENPIIGAIRHADSDIDNIPQNIEVIFLLSSSILTIRDRVEALKDRGKKVFVHVDLIDGLGRDNTAVSYIKDTIKPDGIISTKNNLLRYGREIGLVTVQRLFLIDSLSFETGINIIKNYRPDFVEVMPGIIPSAIEELSQQIEQPIIAGGMLNKKHEIIQALNAGATAISTTNRDLWTL